MLQTYLATSQTELLIYLEAKIKPLTWKYVKGGEYEKQVHTTSSKSSLYNYVTPVTVKQE